MGTNTQFHHHIFHSKNIPKTMSSIACWDFLVHFCLKQFFSDLWGSWYLSCTSRYSVPGFCQVTRTLVFANFASKVLSGYGNHGTIDNIEMPNQVVKFFSFLGIWTLDICHHTSADCPAIWICLIFWQWFDLNYALLVVSGVILCSSHPTRFLRGSGPFCGWWC